MDYGAQEAGSRFGMGTSKDLASANTRALQVPLRLERMTKGLEQLVITMNDLEQRLSLILSPVGPATAEVPVKEREESVPLVAALAGVERCIEETTRRLRGLLSRLEL